MDYYRAERWLPKDILGNEFATSGDFQTTALLSNSNGDGNKFLEDVAELQLNAGSRLCRN
jgi:hypothetical protein